MTARRQLGIDIGSMSVKIVLTDYSGSTVLYQAYRCHQGQQAATFFDMIAEIDERFGVFGEVSVSMTGSGAIRLAPLLHAEYVQEVNAVATAVERDYPEVRAAVDLGGQDAKIVIWQNDPITGQIRRFTNMNEKCAGGTGATIDRVMRKLGIGIVDLAGIKYSPDRVHPVASKCGIFAETDVNSLLKQGVPVQDCAISLFDAITQQNLGTLARGKQVLPPVLLLGGPHVYCPALCQAWEHRLTRLWATIGVASLTNVVRAPEDGLFFAARGCILAMRKLANSSDGITLPELGNRTAFLEQCVLRDDTCFGEVSIEHRSRQRSLDPSSMNELSCVSILGPATGVTDLFIGLDAGSTSTKGVALDASGQLVAKAYQLSEGTPVDSARLVLNKIADQLGDNLEATRIRSLVVTGYAKDYLQAILDADRSIVETVAHVAGAKEFATDTDVILDVGGQDIKVLFLSEGDVDDFRLNTQCSAGNGFYLQNAALRFGIPVEEYATVAFGAHRIPPFKTGCGVFLESDIVTFQQQGWSAAEILAGLAAVLPRNVWEFVVQEPALARRGRRFLLQGGTHRNLAVVRAQIDYIRQRVPDAIIRVHPFAAEAGAIGAALIGLRDWQADGCSKRSSFVGFAKLATIRCSVRRDESTRCGHCSNQCLRTAVTTSSGDAISKQIILASCEKGETDDPMRVRAFASRQLEFERSHPNYVHLHQSRVFSVDQVTESVAPARPSSIRSLIKGLTIPPRPRRQDPSLLVGLPRTLNMWRYAPFFNAYLRAILPNDARIIWSARTTERLWNAASHYNCVDLCFPGKYAIAHTHDLIEQGVDMIVNPALVTLDSSSASNVGAAACPVAMSNPDLVRAAFTTGSDVFQREQVIYHAPVLHFDNADLFGSELLSFAQSAFRVSRQQHREALARGWDRYGKFYQELRTEATRTLKHIVARNEVGILFLGRPYHYDSGLHHGVPRELQKRGYPIFTIESLPRDVDFLDELFGREIAEGTISDPFDIKDVWKHSLSENSNRKIWAAKVAARIPQLAIVDFLSFRCGPDAAVLHVIERIARCAGTPYFALHDMDQNKPTGSLKIRMETIDHYLRQYQARLVASGRRFSEATDIPVAPVELPAIAFRSSEESSYLEAIPNDQL